MKNFLIALTLLFVVSSASAQAPRPRNLGLAPVKLAVPKNQPPGKPRVIAMPNHKREVKFLFPRDWPNPKMFVVLSTKASEVALNEQSEYVFGFLVRPIKNGDIAIIEVRALLQSPRNITKADDMLNLRYEPVGLYALARGEKVILKNLKRYGVKPITLFMLDRPPVEIK
jgi:hypothetical protein